MFRSFQVIIREFCLSLLKLLRINDLVLLRSILSTRSQLHSLQQIATQHDMLPQHLVYKNEPNREYVITLARNDETPWWWSEKIETCRSSFMCLKCFKWKLYRCICWLIVKVILRNARCNGEIHINRYCYDKRNLRLGYGTCRSCCQLLGECELGKLAGFP